MNYVKDTCRGFLAIAGSDDTIGKEINISSNYEISMADVLTKIQEIMNREVEIITDQQRLRPEKSEVFRLWGDNALITELTAFKPEYTIDRGLEETVKWFSSRDNLSKYKADEYNV
jgi:nucleoside-diphosphate-sugar epimerase